MTHQADLDGHTMDELADYLDSGRQPRNPTIEKSPGCQLALEALERLRRVTAAFVAAEEAEQEPLDESWVDWILTGLSHQVRAGRRIPYVSDEHDLAITEGAVRGVVRQAEDDVEGVMIGRCWIVGDIEKPGAETSIRIEACLPYGLPLGEVAEALREAVLRRLNTHTDLRISAIDIVVTDVRAPEREGTA